MSQKVLGVFSLAMMSIIAVCNLRSLTFGALLGKSLVGYYLIALLFFLLPVALITAVFCTHFPDRGGMYSWIKKAFGARVGLIAVWLQWIYNVIWYPTQMIFITSLIASLFFPSYQNTAHIFIMSVILFSVFTGLNFFGMQCTTLAINIATLIGTVCPLIFFSSIALYGIEWNHVLTVDWFPTWSSEHFVYLSGITFGLMGIDICGFHINSVRNPRVTYPLALLLAVSVIILGMMLASLAMVIYVPAGDVDLLTVMIKTLDVFFDGNQYHLRECLGVMIITGGCATVFAWIIGPSKGLLAAAQDGYAPAFLAIEKNGVPVAILLLQWITFVILSLGYHVLGFEVLYLYLSVITTQLALIVYLLFFASFWIMRKELKNSDAFVIPGPAWLTELLVWMGCSYSVFVIIVGFILPEHLLGLTAVEYSLSLAAGMLVCVLIPFFMSYMGKVNR